MPRRIVQNRQRRRTPNRSWTGLVSATSVSIPASSKVLLGAFTLSNVNIDETVLRTVGQIMVESDQSSADELQLGAFGLIIVSDLAIAAGIASIPDPVTDIGDDGWFVYVPFGNSFDFHDNTGTDAQFATQYKFDSKAKRVMEEGQQIAVVVANANATFGLRMAANFRILSMVRGTG